MAKPAGLDWELVRREHARLPFETEPPRRRWYQRTNQLLQLAKWEGCPADLVMECFRDYPAGTARLAAELPFEALVGPEAATRKMSSAASWSAASAGPAAVDRVLAEVRPAMEVLTRCRTTTRRPARPPPD